MATPTPQENILSALKMFAISLAQAAQPLLQTIVTELQRDTALEQKIAEAEALAAAEPNRVVSIAATISGSSAATPPTEEAATEDALEAPVVEPATAREEPVEPAALEQIDTEQFTHEQLAAMATAPQTPPAEPDAEAEATPDAADEPPDEWPVTASADAPEDDSAATA